MKEQILKIAGVKNEKQLYAKYGTEIEFLKIHGKELKKALLGKSIKKAEPGMKLIKPIALENSYANKMTGLGNKPFQNLDSNTLAQPYQPDLSSGFDFMSMMNPGMEIGKGIVNLIEEKKKRKIAEQWNDVSDVTLQAYQTEDVDTNQFLADTMTRKRKAMMPINTGEEFYPIYGTGTEPLAKNGKKIKKAQGGWEGPASEMANKLINGIGRENAGGNLGSTVGGTIGMIWGPTGQAIGSVAGNLLGRALDPNARKIEEANDSIERNMGMMALGNAGKGVQNQYTSFMKTGGQFSKNPTSSAGDLQLYDDTASLELLSHNPYSPQKNTYMLHGAPHTGGGIDLAYGGTEIEAEGGEPIQAEDGLNVNTQPQETAVISGNLKPSKELLSIAGLSEFNNMKFKGITVKIAEEENSKNKVIGDSIKKLEPLTANSMFDKLSKASLELNIKGANMSLKTLAEKKQAANDLQLAINETAEKGIGGKLLNADKLAQGKIIMAKNGGKITKAVNGVKTPKKETLQEQWEKNAKYNANNFIEPEVAPEPIPIDKMGRKFGENNLIMFDEKYKGTLDNTYPVGPPTDKTGYEDSLMQAFNSVLPFLRPKYQIERPDLSPEMMAAGMNQQEPVAGYQTYQPNLLSYANRSYQDIYNNNQADFNALLKANPGNSTLASILGSQKYAANQKIGAEAFRINQEGFDRVTANNTGELNKAQVFNQEKFEKLAEKQSLAKSKTKSDTLVIAKSVADKMTKYKEEKYISLMEQGRNKFGVDAQGNPINYNGFAQFNPYGSGMSQRGQGQLEEGYEDLYNISGRRVATRKTAKGKDDTYGRNGAIVQALKNL